MTAQVITASQEDLDRYTVLRFVKNNSIEEAAEQMNITIEQANLLEVEVLREARGDKEYVKH
jgi:hypothetical protein